MRLPRLILAALLALGSAGSTAVAEDAAGGYRVKFIRAGAGGYNHGSTTVAQVGKDVLVGSPAEISFADVYDPRTGKRKFHFPSFFGLDASSFGGAVASSMRGYLIGDPQANEVYLFARRDGRLLHTLRPPSGVLHLDFGAAVAEVGRTIVVGDHFGGGSGELAATEDPGAAYVFDRGSGKLLRTLTSPLPHPRGLFGDAITRCSGGFAVTQPGDYYEAGAVHIYDRAGHLEQTLQAPTSAPRDWFGRSVAAFGSRLLIGAPGAFPQSAGAAYLYKRRQGRWVLERMLATVAPVGDNVGRAVALSRDRAVVGANNAVMLFDVRTGTLRATLTPPVFDDPDMSMDYVPYLPWSGLGFSVAIVGESILVGTDGSDENAGSIVVGFAPNAPPPPECGTQYPCP